MRGKSVKEHVGHVDYLVKDARKVADLILGLEGLEETDRILVEEKFALIDKVGKIIWRRIRPSAVAAEELEKHGRTAEAEEKWELVDAAIHSTAELQDRLDEMMQLHDDLERMARSRGLLRLRK